MGLRSSSTPVRLLLCETFVNELGDWALMIAAAIWLQELTGSVGIAGLVYVALLVPSFFAPLTGLLADRVPRRGLLIATNSAMAVLVLVLLAVRSREDYWIVLAVLSANGLALTVYAPARSAYVASILDSTELETVGGVGVGIQQSMRLLAPAAGAGTLVLFGPHAVAVGDAASYLVANALLLRLPSKTVPVDPEAGDSWARAVAAGWRTIRANRILRWGAATLIPCAIVGGGIDTAGLSITVRTLHRASSFFAVLTAAQGVGAIAASLVTAAALRRMSDIQLLGAGLLLIAPGVAAWTVPSALVAICGSVVWGFGVTWTFAAAALLPQRHAPDHLQGRTASAMALSITGSQAVGAEAASATISSAPAWLPVALIAVVCAAAGTALLLRIRHADVPTATAVA